MKMSSSSDECEEICPTPDTNAGKNEHLLPAKSRERYIATYENFITWQNEKNTSSFCEGVLMAYFEEIANKYKPSSLWAIYSMLKLGLKSNHGVNMEEYVSLSVFLKKLSKGYVCKKAKVLTIENVEKFIDEAPDDKYLATKVALILGVTGGLRRQELSEITTNDIENHGEVFLIKVPHTKNRIQGSFVIQGKYYNIVKKYQSLRTVKKGVSTRFFQQFRNGKCNAQVIGKNKFGMMPREIAEYLNLPDAKDYTGHSFRKASTTPDSGAEFNLKRQASKSSVPETYTDESFNDFEPNTTQDPLESPPLDRDGVQCRFCGQFSNDCVAVSAHMPYLAGHKTALALNHIRLELDFSNESLPKTVCRNCNAKLHEICEFVKQVNTAQFSLVTVSEKLNKNVEKGHVDALSFTEAEYVKKTANKRKIDTKAKNTSKKKAKSNEHQTEFITDIKVELIEAKDEQVNLDFNDTGTDVKPSEFELANSASVYQRSETSQTSSHNQYNSTKNSGNSEMENSVIDKGNLHPYVPQAENASYHEDHVLYNISPFD